MNRGPKAFKRVRGGASIVATLVLLSMLVLPQGALGSPQPLAGGEVQLTLNRGLLTALRQAGVEVEAVKLGEKEGRRLTAPVSAGNFDPDSQRASFFLSGGLKLVEGRDAVVVSRIRLDTAGKRLSATVGGKRVQLAQLGGAVLAREGFGARLNARRLSLTRAGAAALNRVLALPEILRAGRSLGSLNGFGEPSIVEIGFGKIAMGGPETTFSKLQSLEVQMGIWGGTERWGEGTERYFLFQVEPTSVATDATAGALASAANDGITLEIHAAPPRNMLLRGPRIDFASGELSATLSALSTEGPVTATIATLDYGAARLLIRPKVGMFELMGIRAVATQLMADQLNARFQTNVFQAGETFARVSVTLHAAS